MTANLPSDVGLNAIPELRHVLADLALRLTRRTGTRVHLFCRSTQERDYYLGTYRDGRFTSVTISELLMNVPRDEALPAHDVIAEAKRWEDKLGTTLNRFTIGNRQFGRGYMIGGYYHPRSPLTETRGTISTLHAYVTQLDFWEREIAARSIGLMIGGQPEVAWICRRLGVPYRVLKHARYRNYHYWSLDEFGSHPQIVAAYRTTPADGEAVRLTQTYLTEVALRARFDADVRLLPVIKAIARTYAQKAYWHLRGYEKARQTYVNERAIYHWRRWRDTQRVTRARVASLAAVKSAPYVFFPLQTEPEATLLQNSPEYFFQLEAIFALSRALPAGVKLVVKEGLLAVGRRPAGFYERIASLPNVVLMDMNERGIDVVGEARAVATISSTAGMEALIMGKPVLLFGRHNYFDFLPHARRVEAHAELPALLRWALAENFDSAAAQREGARFLKALEAASFSLGDYDYLDVHSYRAEDVERACEALLASVGAAQPALRKESAA
jgi:hypothetical protein